MFFRFRGKQHAFALGKVSIQEAEAKPAQVDYLLLRLKQRLIDLPPGVDIAEFMQNDGRPSPKSVTTPLGNTPLVTLRDRFLAMHAGAHEKNTVYTARIHFNHLITTLGDKFPFRELAMADLQRHVTRRAAEGIAPVTIKKEINGFRAAWNWGRRIGLVTPEWPGKGLVYQKTSEKPPFQTRAEVARRIARRGLTDQQKAELYESIYLTAEELPQFLRHVKEAARHAFIYPMLCMAAHTGVRRSELIRAEVSDVDFDSRVVTVREKKRVRGQQSFRRIPLSPFLAEVLSDWLSQHPGGNHLFCHALEVDRSKKRSPTTGHQAGKHRPTTDKSRAAGVTKRSRAEFTALTESETATHFSRTVQNSEWSMLSGWHSLRHSFASICASKGIDQRLINAWMGHQTDYRTTKTLSASVSTNPARCHPRGF